MEISRAAIGDGEEILKLQKLAYQREAERYGNYDIPPLNRQLKCRTKKGQISTLYKSQVLYPVETRPLMCIILKCISNFYVLHAPLESVGVVIPPGVVGPEVENFVVAAAASEFSGPVAAFVDVGFVVDFAEPQAYVDIALAFDFSDPVSVVAVEGDSPGRPSFLAFPNVDHYASSSSRVGGVRDLSVHSSTGVRTSYGFCSILSNQGPHQNKNSGHC